MNIGVFGSYDFSYLKFNSKEFNAGLNFSHESIPFNLKLMNSRRINLFDKYASLDAFKNELIPSTKTSLMIEGVKSLDNFLGQIGFEFGIPSGAPNFFKASFNIITYKMLCNNRFKIGLDFSGGLIKNFSRRNKYIHVNDKFFLGNEYGFNYISHTSPSIWSIRMIL